MHPLFLRGRLDLCQVIKIENVHTVISPFLIQQSQHDYDYGAAPHSGKNAGSTCSTSHLTTTSTSSTNGGGQQLFNANADYKMLSTNTANYNVPFNNSAFITNNAISTHKRSMRWDSLPTTTAATNDTPADYMQSFNPSAYRTRGISFPPTNGENVGISIGTKNTNMHPLIKTGEQDTQGRVEGAGMGIHMTTSNYYSATTNERNIGGATNFHHSGVAGMSTPSSFMAGNGEQSYYTKRMPNQDRRMISSMQDNTMPMKYTRYPWSGLPAAGQQHRKIQTNTDPKTMTIFPNRMGPGRTSQDSGQGQQFYRNMPQMDHRQYSFPPKSSMGPSIGQNTSQNTNNCNRQQDPRFTDINRLY